MQFHPKDSVKNKAESENPPDISETENVEDIKDETGGSIWQFPDKPDKDLPSHLFDLFLETRLEKEVLQKRLFKISNEAESILEEQGYTVLFLALGFLEWTEADSAVKTSRAPLVLIPVELAREKVQTAYRISWTKEDICSNISLIEKLKEQAIFIPEFEMPEDKRYIDEYFNQIKTAISKQPNWKLLDDVYLDFFSFTKFVMYKDLDATTWPDHNKPSNHPLMQKLFNPESNPDLGLSFSEQDVDLKVTSASAYHILDADSSQIAVIEEIKSGKNLVVEGPPGTGKSQTIANIIAECLALEKSVLFISEKMAALEVVKNRLDHLGLGPFCFEIHSKKTTRKAFLMDLQRTLDMHEPRPFESDATMERLDSIKLQLNAYATALHSTVGKRKKTPYDLFGIKEKSRLFFLAKEKPMARITLPGVENCSEQEWQNTISVLQNATNIYQSVEPKSDNPWIGCNPGLLLPTDKEDISKELSSLQNIGLSLQTKIDELIGLTGISRPENIRDLKNALGATQLIISPDPIERTILLNPAWNGPNKQVNTLIKYIEYYNEQNNKVLSIFQPEILNLDINAVSQEFKSLSEKNAVAKLLSGRYRQLKGQVLSFYTKKLEKSDDDILNDLKLVSVRIAVQKKIIENQNLGKSLFGSLWLNEMSDAKAMRNFSDWILSFRNQMVEKIFTDQTVEVVSRGASPQIIGTCVNELKSDLDQYISLRDNLFKVLKFNADKKFGCPLESIKFADVQKLVGNWITGYPLIDLWCRYAITAEDCRKTYAAPVIDCVENGSVLPMDAAKCFEGNYADILLKIAFTQHPELREFYTDGQEAKIGTFQSLDRQYIAENRIRLLTKLYSLMPKPYTGVSKTSEMGILLGEFSRCRNHMQIRRLMKEAGSLVQKIKPCFMMSPMSVAQFLDPRTVRFDVVIFDEASQVKPQDALGAILRGNQVAVLGDSRQLPPTSFFEKLMDMQDEESDVVATPLPSDMESILDLCKTGFPAKTLNWHYRSRHESLISVSNDQFYDNKLFVYPSPMSNVEELGLKFHYDASTVYDRGKSRMNRGEAKNIAKAVIEHFRKYPDKSLGVGTFSASQQQAIQEEIEAARINNPDLEQCFNKNKYEHFFVKNLETIQGDERSVIFISVGYGKDKDGILYSNFGPLNNAGGERRLNVLITRARERCVVFSNFKSGDLDLDKINSFGVQAFKLFLEYAETGKMTCNVLTNGDLESPFEESVYDFLVSKGYRVQKQVGCAGFRIDLAIIDPRVPGEFLIGIECDGAMYHSSMVARDRDRLRQQVLEGLGWRLYRIWSTDWYRDPVGAQQRLLKALKEKENEPRPSPSDEKAQIVLSEIDTLTLPNETELESKFFAPPQKKAIFDNISPYSEYKFGNYDYSNMTSLEISEIVGKIVEIEGPIHAEECIARMKNALNIIRMNSKIKESLCHIIDDTENSGKIRIKDTVFLWPIDQPKIILRKRNGAVGNIDYICDEELKLGIIYILKEQSSTEKEDLCKTVPKIFNIKSPRKNTLDRMSDLVDEMTTNGEIIVLNNGKISINPNRTVL